VLIASDTPLDLTALESITAEAGDPLLAPQIFTETELDQLLAEEQVVMLTDQYAPVDQMLTPVFREEVLR
jgi:hypothetical protein